MRDVRVLLAEDNEDHLFLASRALSRVGDVNVEVIPVRDGIQVLDYLYGRGAHEGRTLPDLVLLDLSMPGRSGLDVLQTVKSDQALAHIPVIVLTSSDRPEDVQAAYATGANSFVTKSRGIDNLAEYWTKTASLPGER